MKVVVLDLDGTLLKSDKTLSSRSIEMIERCKEAGVKIVIATARAPRSVKMLLPEAFHQDTWICYNGAEIYQGDHKIYERSISEQAAKQAVTLIQRIFPEIPVSVEINGSMFANQKLDDPWNYEIADLEKIITGGVAKILFSIDDSVDLDVLHKRLPRDCQLVVTDQGSLGQIMSVAVSKLSAVQYLLNKWQSSLKEVVAFGDDFNDMEIIRAAGVGVAMENGIEELKQVADRIAKSNDQDGVAIMFEKLLQETAQGGEYEDAVRH